MERIVVRNTKTNRIEKYIVELKYLEMEQVLYVEFLS